MRFKLAERPPKVMSERKVINKYYPINYDPSQLKRVKRKKDGPQQTKVRMALPMTMTCSNCGNFMARGSKFNARKETVVAEAYLGISVFRFYFRCSKCFQELTFKTDPKNGDYVAEHGVIAGYVHYKAGKEAAEAAEAEKESLEQFDKMKALEMRSMESLAEMEVNEAIDTVLMIQSQRAQMGAEELHRLALERLDPTIDYLDDDDDLTEEEVAELREMQTKLSQRRQTNLADALSLPKRPIENNDEDEDEDPIAARSRLARERMLQMAREYASNSTKTNESKDVESETNKETKSLPSNHPASTVTTTPATSTRPTFKVPLVTPVASSIKPKTAIVSVVPSSSPPAASTASNPAVSLVTINKPLLTTSKYRRDDDDD